MIHVIGNISVCISAELKEPLVAGKTNKTAASSLMLDLSGHGPLLAISAARCGAKVSLISKVSTDLTGTYALDILRREGIQTTGLGQEETKSDLVITLDSKNQETTHICSSDTAISLQTDIIPADHLNARDLFLLSGNIQTNETALEWLEKAKKNGARLIICQAPEEGINNDLIPFADIIISDEHTPGSPANKTAYTITTLNYGTNGAYAHKGNTIAAKTQTKKKTISSGSPISFDIFCGYFAASIHAGIAINRALEIASNAAALSTELRGAYSAIPYLGYLEDMITSSTEEKPTAKSA